MGEEAMNLYVHFPFCRRKCTYCALHSRAGSTPEERAAYVARLAAALQSRRTTTLPNHRTTTLPNYRTIYFGGGSPALCDLRPLFEALAPYIDNTTTALPNHPTTALPNHPTTALPNYEFTVELHPLDVTHETLKMLKDGGVNRISMGVQSLDDNVLRHMGRIYTFAEAERAFMLVKEYFDNAGIDLIVGYPSTGDSPHPTGDSPQNEKTLSPRWARLAKWGLRHCSVYSLILEEKSILFKQLHKHTFQQNWVDSPNENAAEPPLIFPSDDTVLNKIAIISRFLKEIGLERYEISNYAVPGYECQHNLATWRGEDYLGLGDGAHGRLGLLRTRNYGGQSPNVETVSAEKDEIERRIFSLRTREGLSIANHPEWEEILDRFASNGLLVKFTGDSPRTDGDSPRYRLTERGTEVCDSILAELV